MTCWDLSGGTQDDVAASAAGTRPAAEHRGRQGEARVRGADPFESGGHDGRPDPDVFFSPKQLERLRSSPMRPGGASPSCTRHPSRGPSGAASAHGSTPAAGRACGAPCGAAAGDEWARWSPPRALGADRWSGGGGVHSEGGAHRVDSAPVRTIRWGSAGHPGIRSAARFIARTGAVTVRWSTMHRAPADRTGWNAREWPPLRAFDPVRHLRRRRAPVCLVVRRAPGPSRRGARTGGDGARTGGPGCARRVLGAPYQRTACPARCAPPAQQPPPPRFHLRRSVKAMVKGSCDMRTRLNPDPPA